MASKRSMSFHPFARRHCIHRARRLKPVDPLTAHNELCKLFGLPIWASFEIDTAANDQHVLPCIKLLCKYFNRGRGIRKIIDQNRELLQLIQEHAPHINIESWVADTDEFLNCLSELIFYDGHEFPHEIRDWPGQNEKRENPECSANKIVENIKAFLNVT